MQKTVHDDELNITKKKLKRQEKLNIGLTIALILVALLAVKNMTREHTVITPPVVRESFWIDSAHASPVYLQEMSTYFVLLVNNISPSNVDYQQSLFINFVEPSVQGAFKQQLGLQALRVKRNQLSTMFYISGFKIDASTNKVVVIGRLNSLIGEKLVSSQQKAYRLSFQIINSKLYIVAYGEVNQDNPWGDYVDEQK